jgi:hypothetical protein
VCEIDHVGLFLFSDSLSSNPHLFTTNQATQSLSLRKGDKKTILEINQKNLIKNLQIFKE